MKKILSICLVFVLVAGPALAYGPEDDKKKPAGKLELRAALEESANEAARAVVLEGAESGTLALQESDGVAGGKLAVGIAMVAVGVGVVANGFALYEGDPDVFGRKKNADAYLSWGIGAIIALFGGFTINGAMQGRGFNDG